MILILCVLWRGGRSQGTTIDLTFLTPGLYDHLVRYTPLDPAEEVEDYSAVETILGGRLGCGPGKGTLVLEGYGCGLGGGGCPGPLYP